MEMMGSLMSPGCRLANLVEGYERVLVLRFYLVGIGVFGFLCHVRIRACNGTLDSLPATRQTSPCWKVGCESRMIPSAQDH